MGWICPRCQASPIALSIHQCVPAGPAHAAPPVPVLHPRHLSYYNTAEKARQLVGVLRGNVQEDILEKYAAAMETYAEFRPGGGSEWETFRERYTDADLASLSANQHLQLIDEIWSCMIRFIAYNRTVGAMVDPRPGNHPSSLSRPDEAVFRTKGICYRCDSRDPGSVLASGFLPLYRFNPPTYAIATILQSTATGGNGVDQSAGYWRSNDDIVNQTSVCVSRTLRGCGKFPRPQDTGTHYLYAFKLPTQKLGLDTEALQPYQRRWQPGEKAFAELTPAEIIGWTIAYKGGSDTGTSAFNSFRFRIVEPGWNFTARADVADRQYLDDELKALCSGPSGREITVLASEDFVAAPALAGH